MLFSDGSIQKYAANRIALTMYDQVDSDKHRTRIMNSIERHKSDDREMKKSDGSVKDSRGRKKRKITTEGWSFLVKWRDGSESWILLCYINESNPIEVAEYAVLKKN